MTNDPTGVRRLQERHDELEEALKQVLMCSLGTIPDGIRETAKAVYMKPAAAVRVAELERVVEAARYIHDMFKNGEFQDSRQCDGAKNAMAVEDLEEALAALDAPAKEGT